MKELIATLEQNDVDGFTAAVAQYDKINYLDAWFIMILAKIKRGFNAEEEEDLRQSFQHQIHYSNLNPAIRIRGPKPFGTL